MKRRSASLALQRGIGWRLRDWLGLHVYGIYARSLSVRAAAPPSGDGAFSWRVFERGDLDTLLASAGDPRLDLSEAFVRSALAKGDACAAVFRDGRLVSYYWLAFTPTPHESGVSVDFGPKYRYGYKGFTPPSSAGITRSAWSRPPPTITACGAAGPGRSTSSPSTISRRFALCLAWASSVSASRAI